MKTIFQSLCSFVNINQLINTFNLSLLPSFCSKFDKISYSKSGFQSFATKMACVRIVKIAIKSRKKITMVFIPIRTIIDPKTIRFQKFSKNGPPYKIQDFYKRLETLIRQVIVRRCETKNDIAAVCFLQRVCQALNGVVAIFVSKTTVILLSKGILENPLGIIVQKRFQYKSLFFLVLVLFIYIVKENNLI